MTQTFTDVLAWRTNSLTRAMDIRAKLERQGTRLHLGYQWLGDPSQPAGVSWIGDSDVLKSDIEGLVACGLAVKEILRAPRC